MILQDEEHIRIAVYLLPALPLLAAVRCRPLIATRYRILQRLFLLTVDIGLDYSALPLIEAARRDSETRALLPSCTTDGFL